VKLKCGGARVAHGRRRGVEGGQRRMAKERVELQCVAVC